ncbi:oligosaccharide repeat unit polymerase [Vibrio breoganii]
MNNFLKQEKQWGYILAFFLFLIFSNTYALIRFSFEGNLYADYNGYIPTKDNNILLYLAIVLSFLLFLFIYRWSTRIETAYVATPIDSRYMGVFILVYQVVFLVFNIVEGVNQAGIRGETSNPLSYLFNLVRPDILFLLYFASYNKSKLLYCNVLVYLISMLSRGWLGVISDLIIIAIIRRDAPIKSILFSKWSIYCLVIIFLLPILIQFRTIYRLDGIEELSFHAINTSQINLFQGFDSLLSRYQQLFSLIYFTDNLGMFQSLYDAGKIQPLYFQGLIPNFIYKNFLTTVNSDTLGFLLADTSRDLIYGRITAFTTGTIPYFMIGIDWPISLAYMIFCIVFCGFLTRTFGPFSPLYFITFFYLSKYLMAGWFNILFSFLVTLTFFTVIHFVRITRD